MVNDQLLGYVRQQLSLGVSKEVIVTNLKGSGWDDNDINQAILLSNSPASFELKGNSAQINQYVHKNRITMVALVSIVLLLVVVGVGCYLLLKNNIDKGVFTSPEQNSIGGNITTIVNCESVECFNKKFLTCSPATMEADEGFVSFNYEILKPVSDGCQVSMKYTKNPNTTWVNKLMTCTLDNKADFTSEVERVIFDVQNDQKTCSGPLVDTIRLMFDSDSTQPLQTKSSLPVNTLLNTDISSWDRESGKGYQLRTPRNMVDVLNAYGVESVASSPIVPSVTSDAYDNCNGSVEVLGETESRKNISINSSSYCFVFKDKDSGRGYISNKEVMTYRYIKKIDGIYVTINYYIGYAGLESKVKAEPNVLLLLNKIAGTLIKISS